MSTSHKCGANNPATCSHPNCPARRAGMAAFYGVPASTLKRPKTTTMPAAVAPTQQSRDALSEMMDFGRVIWSKGNSSTIRPDERTHGIKYTTPEEIQYVDLDEDGGAPEPIAPAGWEYLTGFTGQHGYHGSTMHDSEYMGGALADHILKNPGYYTTVIIEAWPSDVDEDPESSPVGWGVLHLIDKG